MKKTIYIFALLLCWKLVLAQDPKNLYGSIKIEPSIKQTVSPDVRSWSFLRSLVGTSYSSIQTPLKDRSYKLEESKEFKQGISYYYKKSGSNDEQTAGVPDDYYTVIVKNGKIIGVMLEFLKGDTRSDSELRKQWAPFEKGFLADNYKKVSESEEEYSIDREYRNSAQRTKLRVSISKDKDVYSMVEVIFCQEDIDMDAED